MSSSGSTWTASGHHHRLTGVLKVSESKLASTEKAIAGYRLALESDSRKGQADLRRLVEEAKVSSGLVPAIKAELAVIDTRGRARIASQNQRSG